MEVSAPGNRGTAGHAEGFVLTGSGDVAQNYTAQLTRAATEQVGNIKTGAETPVTTTL